MHRHVILIVAAVAAALVAPLASATLYTDVTGDVAVAGTPANLDIIDVTITNDLTNLYLDIRVNDDIAGTNWGKYMVGIDSPNQVSGDTAGNGWARPINFNAPGMDFWIGSWVDGSGGGAQLWNYSGSWNNIAAPGVDLSNAAAGRTVLTVSLTDLGVSAGDTIQFDVFSSGGGTSDGAVDSLTNPSASIADWGNAYTAANLSRYTVAVPEASSFLFGGLVAGAAVLSRRRCLGRG